MGDSLSHLDDLLSIINDAKKNKMLLMESLSCD